MKLSPSSFFDLSGFAHKDVFARGEYVWSGLLNLKTYLEQLTYDDLAGDLLQYGVPLTQALVLYDNTLLSSQGLDIELGDATKGNLRVRKNGLLLDGASVLMAGAVLINAQIDIGRGVLIETGAYIKGPAVIGNQTEVRQGAYIRGNCLVGSRAVVGHVTEMKHSIMLDDAKAGHFAYLGDSILGNNVNLGAGTKLANLRFTKGTIKIKMQDQTLDTELRKLGAILGDSVQTGCNTVTNPGTLLGKKSLVMPNCTVSSGYHQDNSLIRT